MNKKTSIIATVGPACHSLEKIKELIRHGVNIFRLNFSHSSHEEHHLHVQWIRQAALELGKHIGILGDLSGPKIRMGKVENGAVELKNGDPFEIIVSPDFTGNSRKASTSYPYFVKDIRIGDLVLLDDGNITLHSISKTENSVLFTVQDGGILKNNKGINLPNIPLSIDSLTEKDKHDIEFILKEKLEYVALSFVRSPDCVRALRELVMHSPIRIIAKIEKPEALNGLDEIIHESDAIMIARGDLGVEMPIEKVPVIQKGIIQKCRSMGVPVITATQMLESMINNERPTRAEATDVFNAIIDGSDAVMLSGETAAGQYPVEAVKTMSSIICEAENVLKLQPALNTKSAITYNIPETTAYIACQSALSLKASAIVAFTESGETAQRICCYHPSVPVIAISPSDSVLRKLSLYYGVIPYQFRDLGSTDEMFGEAERISKELGIAKSEDILILVAGIPFKHKGNTNLIKIHKVS